MLADKHTSQQNKMFQGVTVHEVPEVNSSDFQAHWDKNRNETLQKFKDHDVDRKDTDKEIVVGRSDWKTKCAEFGVNLLILAALSYNIGIGVYECFVGGSSADLITDYYDYSKDGVAIDAFPRDIYKDTKSNAGILLGFGLLDLVVSIGTLVIWWAKCERSDVIAGVVIANGCACLIPFCYTAFLTWKVNDLSQEDIDTWNAVNPGFIRNLWRSENIMIVTLVFGVMWSVVVCAGYWLKICGK